jgi:hypothetical protein
MLDALLAPVSTSAASRTKPIYTALLYGGIGLVVGLLSK